MADCSSASIPVKYIIAALCCASILFPASGQVTTAVKLSPPPKAGSSFTKQQVLELRKSMTGTIVPAIDERQWQTAAMLFRKGEKQEQEGRKKEASDSYSESGQILTKMKQAHPYAVLHDGRIRLGQIILDKKNQTLSFPAKITYPAEMPVEVILCRPDSERNYETLMVSSIRPLHLQTMLYLAGFMNGARVPNKKDVRRGDLLDIFIEYRTKAGTAVKRNLDEFLVKESGGTIKGVRWVFVGSNVYKGRLVADLTGESILSWCVSPAVIEPDDENIASGDLHLEALRIPDLPDKSDITIIIAPAPGTTAEKRENIE